MFEGRGPFTQRTVIVIERLAKALQSRRAGLAFRWALGVVFRPGASDGTTTSLAFDLRLIDPWFATGFWVPATHRRELVRLCEVMQKALAEDDEENHHRCEENEQRLESARAASLLPMARGLVGPAAGARVGVQGDEPSTLSTGHAHCDLLRRRHYRRRVDAIQVAVVALTRRPRPHHLRWDRRIVGLAAAVAGAGGHVLRACHGHRWSLEPPEVVFDIGPSLPASAPLLTRIGSITSALSSSEQLRYWWTLRGEVIPMAATSPGWLFSLAPEDRRVSKGRWHAREMGHDMARLAIALERA